MHNPLISVIIPVYNVEQYLNQCVQSVVDQTYKNLEIILIDDGSPDNCPKMCDDWAAMDNRIKVIHQENQGQGCARNNGVSKALGELILFLDSDDWIFEQTVEMLYNAKVSSGADIAVCAFQRVPSKRTVKIQNEQAYTLYADKKALNLMLYQKSLDSGPCGILCQAELCKKHPFPKERYYEDLFTVYKYYWECAKVAHIKQPLYYYRYNPTSTMNKEFTPKMFDEQDAADEIVAFINENAPHLLPAAYSRKFSSYSQVFAWIPLEKQTEEIEKKRIELWQFIRSYRATMLLDSQARLKNRLAACCAFLSPVMYHKVKNLMR